MNSSPSQLVAAVSHIHALNIIHGDIGTHNILVGTSGTLRLCDFGGSRLDGSKCLAFPSARYRRLAQTIETRGSYDPGPKDDIFALGMVLFEVQAGQNLWQDLSHEEVLERIADKKWPELEPSVQNQGLVEVIRNCWNGIYESAEEITTQLYAAT
jgi:serine/threonine protein kinase